MGWYGHVMKLVDENSMKNYDGRGQRTPQSRTTEEALGRHDTVGLRNEVSSRKIILVIEIGGVEGSKWLTPPWEGLIIQTERRIIYRLYRVCQLKCTD